MRNRTRTVPHFLISHRIFILYRNNNLLKNVCVMCIVKFIKNLKRILNCDFVTNSEYENSNEVISIALNDLNNRLSKLENKK